MVNGLLPFEFCHNKIALVEKENKKDYIAMQYLIENAWNLVVTKCLDQEAENTWELKQKMDGGQLRDLPGTRKVYHDQKAKNPKIIQSKENVGKKKKKILKESNKNIVNSRKRLNLNIICFKTDKVFRDLKVTSLITEKITK